MIPTRPAVPHSAANTFPPDQRRSYAPAGAARVHPDSPPPLQSPASQPGSRRRRASTPATASPVASLLVAALLVLRQPCVRNLATARLLLERASADDGLTPVEREACRSLADDLDLEWAAPGA